MMYAITHHSKAAILNGLVLSLFFAILFPVLSMAAVDLPWSTTYDCPDWSSPDSINCDGLGKYGNWTSPEGHPEQITSAAGNPASAGKGQRHWYGDGTNHGSGGTKIEFNTKQPEFWIRWYMRYPLGFTWSLLSYDKLLYIDPSMTSPVVPQLKNQDEIGIWIVRPSSANILSTNGNGWPKINGGQTGDGQFHYYEMHLKMDTNGSNGVLQVWVDGSVGMVVDRHDLDYGNSGGWSIINIGSNQETPANGGDVPVDYDDISISSTGYIGPIGSLGPVRSGSSPVGEQPAGTTSVTLSVTTDVPSTCTYGADGDSSGTYPLANSMADSSNVHTATISGLVNGNSYSRNILCAKDSDGEANSVPCMVSWSIALPPAVTDLLNEPFEDTDFSSRGWYDNTSLILSTVEFAPADSSTASAEFHFTAGNTRPDSGSAARRKFLTSDDIIIEYWVKYSSNWVGSQQNYHPHEFYIMTNYSTDFEGMADSRLTAYVEEVSLYPQLAIADSDNIDQSQIGNNLVGVTEIRGVAGCNGDSDGYGDGDCYGCSDNVCSNSKHWRHSAASITAGTWFKVKARFKLNTIVGGIGQADGIMQYWLNDNLLIDLHDVVLRTGQYSDMEFEQFVISPYIGDGSPIDQTMWVDNLTVVEGAGVAPCVGCGYLNGQERAGLTGSGRVDLN